MINDVSGLADPELATACAETGAALVITHTRTPPKKKGLPVYDDVVAEVAAFLGERVELARAKGIGEERLVLDPGIDLRKTPAESVELLRSLPRLAERGLPLLLAVSRKDFVGALTGSPPAARDAGTLAAVGAALRGALDPARARRRGRARLSERPRCARGAAPSTRSSSPRACAGRRYEHGHDRPARPPLRLAHFVPSLLDRARSWR